MSNYKFGPASLRRLTTCSDDIIEWMGEALTTSPVDFTIVCGHRDEDSQNREYDEGDSQLRWPESRHNSFPSNAVDVAPYAYGALQWHDDALWALLEAHLKNTADRMNIQVEWGGDWKSFIDKPHWEVV